MSMNNVVIEFKNVTFGYHEEATVHSLNVKVNKGDFTAIIGSNGAGNTSWQSIFGNRLARYRKI